MNTRVRIYLPRKLMKNYLNYDYIVVYYEINGNTRKRSYFSDLESANDFYAKCKQKLKSQANALGGQSAYEILEYRPAESLANKMGPTLPALFDKIFIKSEFILCKSISELGNWCRKGCN